MNNQATMYKKQNEVYIMIRKLMPQAFNDRLYALLITMITGLWIPAGREAGGAIRRGKGALIIARARLAQCYLLEGGGELRGTLLRRFTLPVQLHRV